MSLTSPKPTILLLQGSFQLPEVYHKLKTALEATGFPVVQPSLPSLCGQDEPDFASKNLRTDADEVQSVLRRLVEEEKRHVLVLMHSYGGLVGIEAIPEELTRKSRQSRGLEGGVIHLFFFSAFVLAEGQSVLSAFGESPNNDLRPNGRFCLKDPGPKMYSDLPQEEADYWTAKVVDQSHGVEETKLTRAAYRYVPSTYVVCEKDQAVPPQVQEMFGTSAGATLLRLDSGHSPQLSKTDELVGMVAEFANRVMAQSN
jgi:pimeloyl-ACP methyl ester carboxylesterase